MLTGLLLNSARAKGRNNFLFSFIWIWLSTSLLVRLRGFGILTPTNHIKAKGEFNFS